MIHFILTIAVIFELFILGGAVWLVWDDAAWEAVKAAVFKGGNTHE